MNRTDGGAERVIRVFVSSTFRDMQAERDELVKRIFPQLRKRCAERGVSWGEVDLRWGITDEQKAEGKVLPICLAEIERCRPYFIGALGERYGWVPDDIDAVLAEEHPWLREHLERSVTELEIDYGVILNPEMANHAFFYLRDPEFVERLPEDRRAEYREGPSVEEIGRFGAEEAERRAEERKRKLAALKARIRASKFPVRENYPDPKAFGELVLRDLTEVIDRLYPEGSQPDPLDREAAEHDAFARNSAAVYVAREDYFRRLDQHVGADGSPMVVLGESGSGKSALLANWALRFRESHPEEPLLLHFIGSSPQSSDWQAMLRRIVGELDRRFSTEGEIPDDPARLRLAFASRLHAAATRGRVILVLDALDQLEDRDGARDLVWLPPEIPPNVRVVLSTLPGPPLEELERRRWPSMRVEPLAVGERAVLVTEYLGRYARTLGPAHLRRVSEAPQAANPLYLRTMLDELRVWGDHATLGSRIEHYLGAGSLEDLFELVLGRYEEDYEDQRPGLVRDALSLVWAARRGLAEAELLDALGTGIEPLPAAIWSPLSLAAEQSLTKRAGLIGFAHDYLRRAVRDRYLTRAEERSAAHLALADYFDRRREDARTVDELPWQLAEAAAWQRLYDLLADPAFLHRVWGTDFRPLGTEGIEVGEYWARIESNSPLRVVDAYRSLADTSAGVTGMDNVALLLSRMGHPAEAFGLGERLLNHYRQAGDRVGVMTWLGNQAMALKDRGEIDAALALLDEQERICRDIGHRAGLQQSLGNRASILHARGDLDRAMAILEERERLCRELGYRAGLGDSINGRAIILANRGRLDEAMTLHKETERIYRELGDQLRLQKAKRAQALILRDRGRLDEAMILFKEAERTYRELGDPFSLQETLGNEAAILYARADFDGAMALLREKERICRDLGRPAGLASTFGSQAAILRARGKSYEAMALFEEQERIYRELGDRAGLGEALGNRAVLLFDARRFDQAMELLKETERICRDLGDREGLGRALGNQASIVHARGDADGAMALLREREAICRELDLRPGLQFVLANQALILRQQGRLDEALAALREVEGISRELSDAKGLASALFDQGVVVAARGRAADAIPLLEEARRLAQQHAIGPVLAKVDAAIRELREGK